MSKTVGNISKADLHRHVEGSVSPRTLHALYKKNSKGKKTIEDFKRMLVLEKGTGSLDKFIKKLATRYLKQYVKTTQDLCFVFKNCLREAKDDHVDYLEIRFTISNFINLEKDPVNLIKEINKTGANLILGLKRDDGLKMNLELADLAATLYQKHLILGVDLAGNEHFFPNEIFVELGKKLKKYKIPFIVHAGEVTNAQSVTSAVVKLGVCRISHGVKAAQDPKVMEMLAKREILLEVCPTSNIQTGAYKTYEDIPIRTLLNNNVKILICTDDPVTSGITLTSEVDNLINRGIISLKEYKKMLRSLESNQNSQLQRLLSYH